MERKIKRVPITMDLLYDESVSSAEIIMIMNKLSDCIRDSKERIKVDGTNLLEARFMVKDRILIEDNFKENTKKLSDLRNFSSQSE